MNAKKIICLGSGMAALNLALNIPDHMELTLISNGGKTDCNSFMAKGGVAVPLSDEDISDHIEDTLIAGDGHCKVHAVKDLISSAPDMITRLESQGIHFDATVSLEGGHNKPRIRHMADESGRLLMHQLYERVKVKPNIHFLYFHSALELLVEENVCYGALVANTLTHKIKEIRADAVVLTTGGCGGLYQYHTNSATAYGEGYAIASRAGAELTDMEFMQFHPTTLFSEEGDHNLLITEALRGAGAVLLNEQQEQFMSAVHPYGSLAPRDIVSRSMVEEMMKSGAKHLWLDYSMISEHEMKQHFPSLFHLFQSRQYDQDKCIPVSPAAHYMCGGVRTNTFGNTSIYNLFAAGEVACTGLHGANRLASNSLMELLVISERIAGQFMETETTLPVGIPERKFKSSTNHLRWFTGEISLQMKGVMWNQFGIRRHEEEMVKGIHRLERMLTEVKSLNEPLAVNMELTVMQNQLETALIIGRQALLRKESRGCHFREDFAGRSSFAHSAKEMQITSP